MEKFPLPAVHTEEFSLLKRWHDQLLNQGFFSTENFSVNLCCVHSRANKTCEGKICKGKLGRVPGLQGSLSALRRGFSERVNNTCYCYSVEKITIEVLVIQFVFLSHWVRAIRVFYI